jgi:urate oxidase / 2-oxo-4-hydroxy-4-carboxy-5-ureidoimidazoline decarboxylase
VEQFASGWKRSYYGKGDVIVYRLNRDGNPPAGQSPVFGANVLLLVYGEAFWPTYTAGDNTGLIATDSMKNFIQRETFEFCGDDLADYCRFLGSRFVDKYPQVDGAQVTALEVPYAGIDGDVAFGPSGPERATARVELRRRDIIEAVAGIRGFKLLRLGGSAFHGFVRDEYTTLPDIENRPVHMWLDLEWRYADAGAAFGRNGVTSRARQIVRDVFRTFESGSIQQVIYQMGRRLLDEIPSLAEVHLEANNRTWLPIAERGEELGVYMEPPPPYGCLGLRLTR